MATFKVQKLYDVWKRWFQNFLFWQTNFSFWNWKFFKLFFQLWHKNEIWDTVFDTSDITGERPFKQDQLRQIPLRSYPKAPIMKILSKSNPPTWASYKPLEFRSKKNLKIHHGMHGWNKNMHNNITTKSLLWFFFTLKFIDESQVSFSHSFSVHRSFLYDGGQVKGYLSKKWSNGLVKSW